MKSINGILYQILLWTLSVVAVVMVMVAPTQAQTGPPSVPQQDLYVVLGSSGGQSTAGAAGEMVYRFEVDYIIRATGDLVHAEFQKLGGPDAALDGEFFDADGNHLGSARVAAGDTSFRTTELGDRAAKETVRSFLDILAVPDVAQPMAASLFLCQDGAVQHMMGSCLLFGDVCCLTDPGLCDECLGFTDTCLMVAGWLC